MRVPVFGDRWAGEVRARAGDAGLAHDCLALALDDPGFLVDERGVSGLAGVTGEVRGARDGHRSGSASVGCQLPDWYSAATSAADSAQFQTCTWSMVPGQ